MSEKYSTLIGVIVDVSGSMKASIGGGVHEEGGEWIRSLFKVIDSLIKHDVSSSNHMFAIGMGANNLLTIFDVMRTIEDINNSQINQQGLDHVDTIGRILTILEKEGAYAVRKWAKPSDISVKVSHSEATKLLYHLKSKPEFAKRVVSDCLPDACKGIQNNASVYIPDFPGANWLLWLLDKGESIASSMRPATENEIEDAVNKATSILKKDFLIKDVAGRSSIFTVKKASDILHGSVDEDNLTRERVQELFDDVKPFIYGGSTPLFESLEVALQLFSYPDYKGHKKLLLVLSDGYPTSHHINKDLLKRRFWETGIYIVSCFISRLTDDVEPKRLFSSAQSSWEDGAKLLFELSSRVLTDSLPRTLFVKRGWKIDINNNETTLFLQVNHPVILSDVCDLVRNVLCCQDALSDVLTSVSLDIYINQSRNSFGAEKQEGSTCYANASAAVLHLSMKRILGRQGGYPEFDKLRQELINKHGVNGADTLEVLENVCPRYRLHCEEVNTLGAIAAITAKRPVVALFDLTTNEWSTFRNFFGSKPKGILTCEDLDITKRHGCENTEGHAVVLTSYNSQCLHLMNSWGDKWGDSGFFRVQSAHVLELEFIDVFWTENDLTGNEKIYYDKHGAAEAAKFLKKLQGLQFLTHKCPSCKQDSKVTEFIGDIFSAKCPKCNLKFQCDEPGNILSLNMYLTSLSHGEQ